MAGGQVQFCVASEIDGAGLEPCLLGALCINAKKDAIKISAPTDVSQASSDHFIDLLRKAIRSQKKQLIADMPGSMETFFAHVFSP